MYYNVIQHLSTRFECVEVIHIGKKDKELNILKAIRVPTILNNERYIRIDLSELNIKKLEM